MAFPGRMLWPLERSHGAAGEKREGEGAGERSWYGLTTAPARCMAWGEGEGGRGVRTEE